jgi:ribosomal protein L7/L12
VPQEVVDLARGGDRVNAIRRYRDLTNASGDEAREVIDRL